MTRLLTIEEAAEALSVHPNTVRAMLPRLGAVDLNRGTKGKRLIRIPEAGVERYIRECTIQPQIPIKTARQRLERRRA